MYVTKWVITMLLFIKYLLVERMFTEKMNVLGSHYELEPHMIKYIHQSFIIQYKLKLM